MCRPVRPVDASPTAIAKALDCKIFVEARKLRILNQIEDVDLSRRLTTNPNDTNVHIVGMGSVNPPVGIEQPSYGPFAWPVENRCCKRTWINMRSSTTKSSASSLRVGRRRAQPVAQSTTPSSRNHRTSPSTVRCVRTSLEAPSHCTPQVFHTANIVRSMN